MKTYSLCGRLLPQRRSFFDHFDPVRTFKVRTAEGVTRGTPLVGFFGSFLARARNERIACLKITKNAIIYIFLLKIRGFLKYFPLKMKKTLDKPTFSHYNNKCRLFGDIKF